MNSNLWLLSSIKTIYHTATSVFLLVILLKSVSQLSRLVAFLLPLKALLVAGAAVLPRYLDWSIFGGKPAAAVVMLSGVAVLAFLLHLQLEKKTSGLIVKLVKLIPVPRNLMVLSEVQAHKKYQHASKLLELCAAGVMMAVMLLMMPILQWKIGFSFWAICIFVACSLACYWRLSVSFRQRVEVDMISYVSQLSSLLFFTGFALILAMLLSGSVGGIIVAVVSMVMIRVFSGQLVVAVSRAHNLVRNKEAVDLLISGKMVSKKQSELSVAPLEQIIAQERKESRKLKVETWMVLTSADLAIFQCTSQGPRGIRYYILKIYEEKRFAAAKWEELLSEKHVDCGLGTPLVSQGRISSGLWRLSKLPIPLEQGEQSRSFPEIAQVFFTQLFSTAPSSELVQKHDEKFGSFIERLTSANPGKLAVYSMDNSCVEFLDKEWPSIIEKIRSLPLQYVLKVSRDVIVQDGSQSLVRHVLCENWRIGPIGSVFDGSSLRINWHEVLLDARKKRPALSQVTIGEIKLSRTLSIYGAAMANRRWGQAWGTLTEIELAWRETRQ